MSLITDLINLVLHLDAYLGTIIQALGSFTYLALFLVIFVETGFVVLPFLPGDSLLFICGTLASGGTLNIFILFITFVLAAILGDTLNYSVGRYLGPRLFRDEGRFLKKEYLDETHAFFQRYGGAAVFLSRFVPFVRSFAPFVAGLGSMSYGRFVAYNVMGGTAWVSLFLLGGYFFGGLPVVRENLSLIIIAVIVISLVPPGLKAKQVLLRRRRNSRVEKRE